jgi:glycosyltransferase involved in cell wall biosynthesis
VKKRTVLIIENSVNVTGALNSILSYAGYAQSEFEFIFVVPKGAKVSDRISFAGFEVEHLPFVELNKSFKSILLYFPFLLINAVRLNFLVKKHAVQIVHVNDFYNQIGAVAKFLGGRFSLIIHVRFIPSRFPYLLVQTWMKLNMKYAEAIVCVSYAVKNNFLDHPKIKVIYDGLPSHQIQQAKERENKNYLNLLYLGHYIKGKGQDFALEAFAHALRTHPSLRMRFVGGDMDLKKNKAYKEFLIIRARQLGIEEFVEFCGPTVDVDGEMSSADVALNFSESESFSMTCLEALSRGVPLIATDCGGPAELFEHGNSGVLVPNKNIKAMCDAILHLAGDEKKRLKFSENSVNYVSKKFSPNVTFGRLRNIYKDALLDV